MPIESISLSVCEKALSFADKDSKKKDEEKKRVARPFGVALFIAGVDDNGEAKLFRNDPSGNYTRFHACAIGAGGENGMHTLTEEFKQVFIM